MLIGLPASGKSTWATEELEVRPVGSVIRVNKDLLREMLHAGRFGSGTEKQVLAARDAVIVSALQAGLDVIVDDTNLNPFHRKQLVKLAERYGAEFEEKHFDESVDVCVERDALRPNPVGEDVIRAMHARWVKS